MSSTSDPANLDQIFKAYDVRGLVPDQLDEPLARAVGAAFVHVTAAADGPGSVVVGHDMRPSSPAMARAFAGGAASAGADVVMIGLASTDQLYFASGNLGIPGAMPSPGRQGTIRGSDVLPGYPDPLRSLVPGPGPRLTVVVDAGNGMAGH